MIYHYEDRIRRLIIALREIADDQFGSLTSASFARRAIEVDEKLAEQYRRDIRLGGEE